MTNAIRHYRSTTGYVVTRFIVQMGGTALAIAAVAVWIACMIFAPPLWPQELPRGPFLGGPQYNPYGTPTDKSKWAGSPLKPWFDGLQSKKGLCCSSADGRTVDDPDWGTMPVAGANGKSEIRFWVVVDGQKLVVPPDAVVTEPNKFGAAVVWPFLDGEGKTQIRCFIAGAQG